MNKTGNENERKLFYVFDKFQSKRKSFLANG